MLGINAAVAVRFADRFTHRRCCLAAAVVFAAAVVLTAAVVFAAAVVSVLSLLWCSVPWLLGLVP